MQEMTLEQVNDFRARVLRREALRDEEIAAAIAWLRQNRISAKPKGKKEKVEKKPVEHVSFEEIIGL
jgi:hypothetical protein